MCGISGICAPHPEAERLKRMTAAMAHRGPDATGHYLGEAGGVALGHNRLSILDLSEAANQPFFSAEVGIGQIVLMKAKLMKQRGMNVPKMVGLLHSFQADFIGGADHLSTSDTATGHPHSESKVVMVTPAAGLSFW